MKKILILLVACLLVSCQKEQLDPNLDGTTWEFSERHIYLNGGVASFYYGESFFNSFPYTVNEDTITFGGYIGGLYPEGTLNKKRDRMYMKNGIAVDGIFVEKGVWEFVRVKK